jgi:hypothetical protein
LSNSTDQIQAQDSTHSYNFGTVWVNSSTSIGYKVTNTGTTPLKFVSATIRGIDFTASHSCRAGLEPQAICGFDISYWPFSEGFHSGLFQITFETADGSTDTISVELWGQARRM